MLLLLMAITSIATAQFEIRPFIGANFSNITESPDGLDTKAKVGGQLGASLLIGNKFHLMPGIAMFSRSTEYSDVNDITIDQKASGIIIPILVGYRFIDPSNEPFLNVRLWTGPSLMFLTKTEFDDELVDESVDWNSSQWGYQLGAGVDISIFFVDLGYEIGLSNTGESKDPISSLTDIKSNTFYLNLGVRLVFAK